MWYTYITSYLIQVMYDENKVYIRETYTYI